MSDKLSNREISVLQAMVYGKEFSASSIAARLDFEVAPATLRRTLGSLTTKGYLVQTGERKGTVYHKTLVGALKTPYESGAYFEAVPRQQSLTTYQFDVFAQLPIGLIDEEVQAELEAATTAWLV